MVEVDKGHETRQSAIAWREHVFVAATAAWESRNVIRLTDIKLKYPFWEFAASRVADLPVMFPLSAFSSPFFSLPFFFVSFITFQSPYHVVTNDIFIVFARSAAYSTRKRLKLGEKHESGTMPTILSTLRYSRCSIK